MIKTFEKGKKVKDKRQEYIHYGHKEFDKKLFKPIKEFEMFIKPKGGLWASRADSKNGWKEWCKENDFCLDKYSDDNYFKFYLKEGTKVLLITNSSQLIKLPHINVKEKYGFNYDLFDVIDFEKLAEEYDAMEVLISQDCMLYWDLYGWDCDSLLVFNKDCIESISEEKL